MVISRFFAPLLALCCAGCLELGGEPKIEVHGQLTVGPGVVFIERGPIYEGTFERCGLFDSTDHDFQIDLVSSGPHGFHAYLNDYIYLPIAVEVEAGYPNRIRQAQVDWEFLCESAGMCMWADQSPDPNLLTPAVDDDLSNNPVISDPRVVRVAERRFMASVQVDDPEGDLSNQILLCHLASGIAVQMNPSGPPVDGNYPNGEYTYTVILPDDVDPSGPWQFVAADHTCSNSPIYEVMPTGP